MQHKTDQVSLLLAKWEELRDAGQECSPEELCSAAPELLDEVRRKIHAIQAIEERFPDKDNGIQEPSDSEQTGSFHGVIETSGGSAPHAMADVPSPSSRRKVRIDRKYIIATFPWLIAAALLITVVIVTARWQAASRRIAALEQQLAEKPVKNLESLPEKSKALSKSSKTAARDPIEPDLSDSRYQHLIAGHWFSLGKMLNDDKRFADAETCFQRALKIQEKLAEALLSETLWAERVRTLNYLGFVRSKANKSEQAEQSYRRAIAILRKLAADNPDMADYTCQLGVSLQNLALLLMKSHPEDARKLLEEAVNCQYRALEIRPGDKNYCNCLRQHLLALKTLHQQRGDEQAVKAIEAKLSQAHAGCW